MQIFLEALSLPSGGADVRYEIFFDFDEKRWPKIEEDEIVIDYIPLTAPFDADFERRKLSSLDEESQRIILRNIEEAMEAETPSEAQIREYFQRD